MNIQKCQFLTAVLTIIVTAGFLQAQITLKTDSASPGAGSILVDQGGGVAAWAEAPSGGGAGAQGPQGEQGPQGKQGDPGAPGSSLWTDSGGNPTTDASVGIGTTSPSGRLQVVQSSNGLWAAKVSHTKADGPVMLISHDDAGSNRNAVVQINTGSQGPPVFIALATGQVGINMSSKDLDSNPSTKFFVVGTAKSAGWDTYSDARLKQNVETVSGALDKVTRLRGVNYDWRADAERRVGPTTGRHLGLIAQEVEAVVPEVVGTSDDGYKSINYNNLTGLLIEAIKEQQRQIEALQAQQD